LKVKLVVVNGVADASLLNNCRNIIIAAKKMGLLKLFLNKYNMVLRIFELQNSDCCITPNQTRGYLNLKLRLPSLRLY